MAFGIGSSSKRKDKSSRDSIRAQDPEDEARETSPLLGSGNEASATQRNKGNGIASGSRPQSAVVRHGRGLLSEDGDGDGDAVDSGDGAAAANARDGGDAELNGNGHASDDDDNDDDADETSGLLGWRRRNSNTSNSSAKKRRAGLRKRLSAGWIACYVLLGLLAIAFAVFAVVHVWVGRFVSEQMRDNAALLRARAQDALVYRGPDSVKILNMDSESTTVQVQMRMGIDVRTVFGWNGSAENQKKLLFSRRMERKLIGWATRRTGQTSMDLPEPVQVSPLDLPDHKMLYLATKEPITLPLHFPQLKEYDPEDLSWLRNVTITVPMEVVDPDVMATFVNASLANKQAKVHVKVPRARVTLGRENDRGWLAKQVRHYGGQEIRGIELDQTVDCECNFGRISSTVAVLTFLALQCRTSQPSLQIHRIWLT